MDSAKKRCLVGERPRSKYINIFEKTAIEMSNDNLMMSINSHNYK